MHSDSLKHLSRLVGAFVPDRRIVVLGSSAFLAKFPELGEAGQPIEASLDADFVVEEIGEDLAGVLLEALGEESQFQNVSGVHADVLRPVICEQFPRGWEERLVPLEGCENVFCLEEYDVAVAKLRAGREKDSALLRILIETGRLDGETLRRRLSDTAMREAEIVCVHARLAAIRREEG